ncbi:methanol dehydrogenase [Rubrivivax gelatinosus]|uniref:Methanol dehydrogenase [cytochrome c] subunit 2 n=1 Tax=Rubrivivax gelatinosus TaxID=28068 RepID=A0ABS1E0D9_RUBGE|nr:methanol dehydrogenase [Rubrivivax gelatinosus]MBK1614326.1 methanol dehydrogenase [Rubrivivax gelatinosus]MBK1714886.1 methanol dehydrogenase [Rubrivivax gelatinosus]
MTPQRTLFLTAAGLLLSGAAFAYDGTNCKAPGDCWEAKPGYPEKVAGSKYDPKHDPVELRKNEDAVKAMEARNAKRLEAAQKTGSFNFNVK